MGNENSALNDENLNKNNNNEILLTKNHNPPEFFLSNDYPNEDKLTLEQILSYYLGDKNFSFNNNEKINNLEDENTLTPKFNTKKESRNIKALNINSNCIEDKENEQIKNDDNCISQINNSNININININIDLPKIAKSKSIIKTLQNSSKESNLKQKNSKTKEQKTVKYSQNTNIITNLNNQKDFDFAKMLKKNELNIIYPKIPIQTKPSSLMKDIRKEFKFAKPLGGGHFGTVRKAYRRSDKEPYHYFAVKSISIKNMTQKDYDDLVKEVDIISNLDHPNIIKFYETYHDECFFHIVMELCKGKEVFDNICNHGYLPEKKVQNIIFKVLLAIAHCHSRGITHRDLKPENILFESLKPDAEIKLIDFGLSRKYSKDEKMHTILGTPYYVAPEVLKGEYDEKCDIWSIGAMTYLMLCGDPPFTGGSNHEIFKKIMKADLKFNLYKWKNISDDAKDFVKLCLNKNAGQRPSASQAVNHKWFKNVVSKIHNMKNVPLYILENIKNFDIGDKFKQMIIKYIINNTSGSESLNIYKNAFYAFDFNNNGWIELSELKKVYDLCNINIDDEKLSYIYNLIIQDKKGGIDYTEFLMAGINRKELFSKEKLANAFNYFDANKSGYIETVDLEETLLKMGKECTELGCIKSIIKNALLLIKNEEEFLSSEDEKEEKEYKICRIDFFRMFE